MMKGDVSPTLDSGQRIFHAYEDDSFRLGQEVITSTFYFHQNMVQPWLKTSIASLTAADFTWLEKKKT
ncbi:MAG: hypothetical protein Q9M19_02330 [Mariprofundaceae bacterium]|nr:hypothetical protein [Mariprofundaceae bacterium]